ncbi:MAG TPA: hypothetical protein VG846_15215, partial [Actinomycetota bacterium]|nr:hypothetical protein [Actinomycetota bacterium]
GRCLLIDREELSRATAGSRPAPRWPGVGGPGLGGPGLGGLPVRLVGAPRALLLDAASFLFSMAIPLGAPLGGLLGELLGLRAAVAVGRPARC